MSKQQLFQFLDSAREMPAKVALPERVAGSFD